MPAQLVREIMATLAAEVVSIATGLEPTWIAAAVGGDEAPCGNNRQLMVRNRHTAAQTVTVATPGTVRGLAIGDVSKAVTPNGGVWTLPLIDEFKSSTGRAAITYTGVTALDVAVVEPPVR